MARPKDGYRLADGTRVPGVTTILSRFKDAGPLMHWAWEQGRAGLDYRETRDVAAEAGTLAHAMIEAFLQDQPAPLVPASKLVVDRAQKAFQAFMEWRSQTLFKVIESEVSMLSETLRVGGTLDHVVLGDKRVMSEIKTSNGLYPDMLVQLAAYGLLWEENRPAEPIEGYLLLRLDKTFGDLHVHYWQELDTAKEAFKLMRALYDCDRELKQRAK